MICDGCLQWLRNCESGDDSVSGTWRHLSSYIIKNVYYWKDAETHGTLWEKDHGTVLITVRSEFTIIAKVKT